MKDLTKAIHSGELERKPGDPVNLPVYQSANFLYGGESSYLHVRYARLSNTPNHDVIHRKIAAMERAESCVVAASGMCAITSAILGLVPQGGEILAQQSLYGGTHEFFTKFSSSLGRDVRFFSFEDIPRLETLVSERTSAIYLESISNPLLQVIDIPKVVEVAKKRNLITFVDNTMASPVNFNPHELGIDIVLHSASKYLNGHCDIVAGCIVGSKEHVLKVRKIMNCLGGSLDAHACFLLHRGLKTVGVRVRHQNDSAASLASFLEGHSKVDRVFYPGLSSDTGHKETKKHFRGFGGVISFEIKGNVDDANRLIEKLKFPLQAPSLGGVDSLVVRPAATSHCTLSSEELKAAGIADKLIRVSVGLEDSDDLIEDFDQALQ